MEGHIRFAAVPSVVFNTAADLGQAVAAARPLVVKGLLERWPALAAGRESPKALNRYLKSLDRGLPGTVMEAPASAEGRFGYSRDMRELTFSKRQQGLSETLDRIEHQLSRPNASTVAIQMLPLATHLPDFIPQNPMPLLPHTALANLYIGPIDNPPPLSVVDLDAPDFHRFPRFEEALKSAQVAELECGDAIFMPRHWWHHVTSLDPYNAMVNYWWGAQPAGLENPHACFLTALLALKDLPAAERSYWRVMFDTYVFQTSGNAVDHIPADLQGVLGSGRPAVRAALKQKLKGDLLKS